MRPITRRAPTDRLLEGVALLASGEPVGVLSPSMLSQREYLRALPAARPQVVIRRVRVLLVDDSLVTREMERRLLEDAGFEVVAAGDAEEALSLLGEETFNCVVTDIEMPRMDGFELAAHLRGMEHFAHLPIIVVSTRDRPEDRLRGLKVGRRRLPDQAEPGRRRAGRPGAAAERERAMRLRMSAPAGRALTPPAPLSQPPLFPTGGRGGHCFGPAFPCRSPSSPGGWGGGREKRAGVMRAQRRAKAAISRGCPRDPRPAGRRLALGAGGAEAFLPQDARHRGGGGGRGRRPGGAGGDRPPAARGGHGPPDAGARRLRGHRADHGGAADADRRPLLAGQPQPDADRLRGDAAGRSRGAPQARGHAELAAARREPARDGAHGRRRRAPSPSAPRARTAAPAAVPGRRRRRRLARSCAGWRSAPRPAGRRPSASCSTRCRRTRRSAS